MLISSDNKRAETRRDDSKKSANKRQRGVDIVNEKGPDETEKAECH